LPDVPDDPEHDDESRHGHVILPDRIQNPWLSLAIRLLIAVGILVVTILIVYVDRGGYRDNNDYPTHALNLLDATYYSMVTLAFTGVGDITPVSDTARMVNAFVITPLRIAFLVILISTILEVVAAQGRRWYRTARWRNNMSNHVVIVGYGTKGRSAVETLVNNGISRDSIVVVDKGGTAVSDAHADGLAVVTGDATRREVLQRARVEEASQVIITTDRDDSNVLSTLTVRQLNGAAWIVASVREEENAPLMKQSGANSVITSSAAVGRLLGLSSLSPTLGTVMEDLMSYGEGLEVAERELLVSEVGQQPQSLPDQVIAVVRDDTVYRYFDPTVTQLTRGDQLIVIRPARELPWAPRPGTHNEETEAED
jgi:voltage-gated potassium channel